MENHVYKSRYQPLIDHKYLQQNPKAAAFEAYLRIGYSQQDAARLSAEIKSLGRAS